MESYLLWLPTHEMMWASASNIRVSRVLCQSTTTTFLKVFFPFLKDMVPASLEEAAPAAEEAASFFKDVSFFKEPGAVSSFSLARLLHSLSLRACSLAASSAVLSLFFLLLLLLLLFLFQLLGDAWAFFKASSFSSRLPGEVQGGSA